MTIDHYDFWLLHMKQRSWAVDLKGKKMISKCLIVRYFLEWMCHQWILAEDIVMHMHHLINIDGCAEDLMNCVQSTLPKSNNRPSQRSIQVLFSLYSIVFNPSWVKFSLSRRYFFNLNRFDLGRVDCIFLNHGHSSNPNFVFWNSFLTLNAMLWANEASLW